MDLKVLVLNLPDEFIGLFLAAKMVDMLARTVLAYVVGVGHSTQ